MQRIRLAFSDFPGPTNSDAILKILSTRYDVHVTDTNPDYVIYSVFGYEYLQFENVVRIFFTGENVRPDFNLCDYAFSYDWLDFGDRHFRAPNFILYDEWRDIVVRRSSALAGIDPCKNFCNFIYSNGDSHPIRDRFFHALNAVEPVESFGAHLRNSDREIGEAYLHKWSARKIIEQKKFKFSISFENSSTPGYTTEKLVHALCADTIPIYWGDPLVGRVFNPRRFIDMNVLSFEEAILRVMSLHRDDNAYLDMVNRPFFANGAAPENLSDRALLAAFEAIFSVPKEKALHRNPHFWGRKYESRRRHEIKAARLIDRLDRLRFWKR